MTDGDIISELNAHAPMAVRAVGMLIALYGCRLIWIHRRQRTATPVQIAVGILIVGLGMAIEYWPVQGGLLLLAILYIDPMSVVCILFEWPIWAFRNALRWLRGA